MGGGGDSGGCEGWGKHGLRVWRSACEFSISVLSLLIFCDCVTNDQRFTRVGCFYQFQGDFISLPLQLLEALHMAPSSIFKTGNLTSL